MYINLLDHLDYNVVYWGNHGNNIVPQKGILPDMQERFLENVKYSIERNPVTQEEILATNPW